MNTNTLKHIITRNKAMLAAAVLTLSLTGCALTPATESLKYTPQANVQRIPGAENISVNVVTTDSRVDKAIGHKKNAYGMTLTTISAEEPVEVTVDRAIEQELKERGYSIRKDAGLMITANVTKFYNEFSGFLIANSDASVNLSITIKMNSKVIYTQNIHSENRENGHKYLIMESAAKKSLEDALAKAIIELFNDPSFIAALTATVPAKTAGN